MPDQAAAKKLAGLAALSIQHEATEPGAAEIRRHVAHLASYLPHNDASRHMLSSLRQLVLLLGI